MPLPIFRRRAVAVPNVVVVIKSMAGAAKLYVLTLYFQDALGGTPLQAGLLLRPHDLRLRRRLTRCRTSHGLAGLPIFNPGFAPV